jgi:hypothetical protein
MREEVVTRCNVLLKLTCGHTRLLHGVRSDSFPEIAWCNDCADGMGVTDHVDNRDQRISEIRE